MRSSQFFLSTLKEAPSDAEIVSHRLMLRAGLIKRLAGGVYTWMPLGLRVLRKVEKIVREEMERAGAIELLMPAVQPAELWQESGRWEKYGPELLRFKDRHQRDFVIGPTHEEVITDIVRKDVKSHRQLPLHFYQIQNKFRDEIRPRFGVMRGREFLMKDAYSFHANFEDLEREYQNMYATYSRIFTRLGLKFRAVAADTGSIGGTGSHEFHVLADSGEDALAYCPNSDYAANVELAVAIPPASARSSVQKPMRRIDTPKIKSCEDLAQFLGVALNSIIKTIAIVRETSEHDEPAEALTDSGFTLLLLRADHQLNEIKAQKVLGKFRFAHESEIIAALACPAGYIGPVTNNSVVVFADHAVAAMSNFVCGANEQDAHLCDVNFVRDLSEPVLFADLRNVVAQDPSPDGQGHLELCRGIEVGHIFQLRTQYAKALKCTFLDERGETQAMEMGCYGIGVSRIVGAAIEQNNDERGILFPPSIAPFEVCIVPMNYAKNKEIQLATDALYAELKASGIDVLLDDRNERAGVLFADMELIGIPHRLVIGERGLAAGMLEYKARNAENAEMVARGDILSFLKDKLCPSA
ncbi:MAG: proline--tRNA ligase [Pseudomonadota bacterium]